MDLEECQILLIHAPKRAALRSRKLQSHAHRRTPRDYVGLTQVCKQIRYEYRPWYMLGQQVALDLADLNKYIDTFYPENADFHLRRTGNLTVAIRTKLTAAEKRGTGLDMWPLLSMWARCSLVQTSFGRYYRPGYDGARDNEAKDLYRLFCRRISSDRILGPFNHAWMSVLAEQKLSAVFIQRDVDHSLGPYIHILFKPEHKEPWMISEFSPVPTAWLEEHGFANMEHFDIEVGICDDSAMAPATTAPAHFASSSPVKIESYDFRTWCAVNSSAAFRF